MTAEELLDKLEGVRPINGGHMALCPSHPDRNPSLEVTETDDRILLKCHAGCDQESVVNALGIGFPDLFLRSVNYSEPEQVYSYVDETGRELFQVLRFPGKKFRQRHKDEEMGEWTWDMDGVRRVPYHLDKVIEAIALGSLVVITEGEKDADALIECGICATCNPAGAGKWRPEFNHFFEGAKVIVWQDRDEAGRKHAASVRENLTGIAAKLHIVRSREGKDAYDHCVVHGFKPEEAVTVRDPVRRGIVTAREMAEQARDYLDFDETDLPGYPLLDGFPVILRQGRMYALGAYTGEGKTTAALQFVRGLMVAGRRVGYFSLEMSERDLRNRLIAHKGIPQTLLESPWILRAKPKAVTTYHDAVNEMERWSLDIDFDSSVTPDRIIDTSKDREYEVVILDHIHRLGWGKDRRQLEEHVTKLTNLAVESNITLLVLCQLRKYQRGPNFAAYPRPTKDDFRETSQIADDASMALAVWRQRAKDGLTYEGHTELVVLKNRHTTCPDDAPGKSHLMDFDLDHQWFTPKLQGMVPDVAVA